MIERERGRATLLSEASPASARLSSVALRFIRVLVGCSISTLLMSLCELSVSEKFPRIPARGRDARSTSAVSGLLMLPRRSSSATSAPRPLAKVVPPACWRFIDSESSRMKIFSSFFRAPASQEYSVSESIGRARKSPSRIIIRVRMRRSSRCSSRSFRRVLLSAASRNSIAAQSMRSSLRRLSRWMMMGIDARARAAQASPLVTKPLMDSPPIVE